MNYNSEINEINIMYEINEINIIIKWIKWNEIKWLK
jgi:hypothetical protein